MSQDQNSVIETNMPVHRCVRSAFKLCVMWCFVDADGGHCEDIMLTFAIASAHGQKFLVHSAAFQLRVEWSGRDAPITSGEIIFFKLLIPGFCVVEGLGAPTFMACAPAQIVVFSIRAK